MKKPQLTNSTGFQGGEFDVQSSPLGTLIIRRRLSSGVLRILAVMAFACIFYWILLGRPMSFHEAIVALSTSLHLDVTSRIKVVLPMLFFVILIVSILQPLFIGNPVQVRPDTRLLHYGRKAITFEQVRQVEVKPLHGHDVLTQYLLTIRLADGSRRKIVSHTDQNRVEELGERLASLISVPFVEHRD